MLELLTEYVKNNTSFILYCDCNVKYDGRASSILDYGNYLIIYKADGSLQIHASNKISPRNYQGAKSLLSIDDNQITSINKLEKIIILLRNVYFVFQLRDWSNNEITITKTEKDLVDKLCLNWNEYMNIACDNIVREYKTDHGPVDIVGLDRKNIKHVIEVKRRKATIKDVTQLRKYLECIDDSIGYLAAPSISTKAKSYLYQHECNYINIDFES